MGSVAAAAERPAGTAAQVPARQQQRDQPQRASCLACTSSAHFDACGCRYRIWWWITIAAACITGWLEPFRIAFGDSYL